MSGDFSQSVGKCSILSRNTHKCVSPFVSFEQRFFERGGLKKEEERNKVGTKRSFYVRKVTLRRVECSHIAAGQPPQPPRPPLSETTGYPAEAESAMTGSPNTATGGRRGHFTADKSMHSFFEPLRCGVLQLSNCRAPASLRHMASFGCHSFWSRCPRDVVSLDSVFVWPSPPHHSLPLFPPNPNPPPHLSSTSLDTPPPSPISR